MLKRSVSGAVYVILIVGFFLLKVYWRAVAFDALLWFMCAFGTFEIARALKRKEMKCGFGVCLVSGATLPVAYVVAEYFLNKWYALYIVLGVAAAIALSLFIARFFTKESYKSFGITVLNIFYPFLGVLSMMILNDVDGQAGFIGLVLIFAVSALSDTLAYLTGMTYNKLRRGNAKRLCPTVSPNKTVAGALGGFFGGAVAGLLVYFIFRPKPNIDAPLFVFIFVGLIASIVNLFGDLFESYIKRSVGIKDIGKIMPGHGGLMDRIDGITFTSIYVLAMMAIM